jgi:hypothetical protein
MYVYIQSEPTLYTVGFEDANGKWFAESDHDNSEDAAKRVAFLNGYLPPIQIEEDKKTWQIESTDRYYFLSGRNSKQYQEVTFWYNPFSFERKETTRIEYCSDGQEYKLPEWCKSCIYRKSLNYE